MEPTTAWMGAGIIALLWFIPGYAAATALKFKGIDRWFVAPMFGGIPYLIIFFLHKNFALPINEPTVLIIVWSVFMVGTFLGMLIKTEEGYAITYPLWIDQLKEFMDDENKDRDSGGGA